MTELADLLHLQIYPESDRLEQETLAWFDALDLSGIPLVSKEKLRTYEFARGVGASLPTAEFSTVLWWSKFTLWYMIIDDNYAETAAVHDLAGYLGTVGEIWRISQDTMPPELPGTPLASVLNELLDELDSLVNSCIAARIRHALRDYFFAAAWEAAARSAGSLPDPSAYHTFRRHFALFVLNVEFVEHLPGLLLTDDERRIPEVRKLRALACDVMGDINVLCSLRKEVTVNNFFLPEVTSSSENLNEYASTLPVLCRSQAREILQLGRMLAPDPKLSSYATAIAKWVAGTTWWHQQALRHRYQA